MNNGILNDVMGIAGNISPLSVAALLGISLVGTVLMITLCNCSLYAVSRLWTHLFGKKD